MSGSISALAEAEAGAEEKRKLTAASDGAGGGNGGLLLEAHDGRSIKDGCRNGTKPSRLTGFRFERVRRVLLAARSMHAAHPGVKGVLGVSSF